MWLLMRRKKTLLKLFGILQQLWHHFKYFILMCEGTICTCLMFSTYRSVEPLCFSREPTLSSARFYLFMLSAFGTRYQTNFFYLSYQPISQLLSPVAKIFEIIRNVKANRELIFYCNLRSADLSRSEDSSAPHHLEAKVILPH